MTILDLPDITENGLCSGCGGCVAAIADPAVTMVMTDEGYLRPRSPKPLTARESRTLAEICAGRTLAHATIRETYHPLWGPIHSISTGYANDPEVRHRGSSGGVLTAIGIALVESGKVDFVLSTAADPADPIGNRSEPKSDRAALVGAAGSRYAPSTPLADLEKHLVAGRPFAFVGKPCDVATLRRMALHDPRVDRLIPIKLAFFCAGVPSRKGALGVLDALGVAEKDVASFRFRGDGWPGLARAIRHDGTEASMDYNSSWGTILNRHLQFRCKICPDGTGEFADIVCADAWYGKDGYPDFTEQDGRSLIVARTEAGQQLLDELVVAACITTAPLDATEIAKMQPYQVSRKRNALARSMALWVARRRGPRFSGLSLFRLALGTPLREQFRNAVGTFRRVRGKILS